MLSTSYPEPRLREICVLEELQEASGSLGQTRAKMAAEYGQCLLSFTIYSPPSSSSSHFSSPISHSPPSPHPTICPLPPTHSLPPTHLPSSVSISLSSFICWFHLALAFPYATSAAVLDSGFTGHFKTMEYVSQASFHYPALSYSSRCCESVLTGLEQDMN
eukprot:746641-Hanusia_phi.AAC.1